MVKSKGDPIGREKRWSWMCNIITAEGYRKFLILRKFLQNKIINLFLVAGTFMRPGAVPNVKSFGLAAGMEQK